jgi:hypothetical protein
MIQEITEYVTKKAIRSACIEGFFELSTRVIHSNLFHRLRECQICTKSTNLPNHLDPSPSRRPDQHAEQENQSFVVLMLMNGLTFQLLRGG